MSEPDTATPALPPAGRYRLDPQGTFAQFGVRHMVVGRVDGRFDSLAGEFVVLDDRDRLFDASDVRIDAASVDTNVPARDDDLRSSRFLDVASFPELAFQAPRAGAGPSMSGLAQESGPEGGFDIEVQVDVEAVRKESEP